MKHFALTMTLLVLSATSSPAITYTFIASGPAVPGLNPANENPSHSDQSSATGTAMVTWDTATNQMTVHVVFSGLTTPNTAAHIHCCVAAPGTTGVATTTPTFTGFPGGVTSGTYSHSFDMLSASSYNPAFVTAHGGVTGARDALLAGMLAGQTYLNIHTTMFGSGEERGFLIMPVDLSIKPGSSAPVPINTKSHGNTPVAILSSANFNALTMVNATSLRFGATGQEKSLLSCDTAGEDVNGDGLLDLVCHFDTQSLGLSSGSATAILTGTTFAGATIMGQEAIRIVP
jgi:hypothetical protein